MGDFDNDLEHKVFLKLQGFIDGLPLDVSVEHLNFGDDKCANGEVAHVTITGVVCVVIS